ncbi:MAG: EAL domain-containing protein [Rhodocyclaceae bacterium]|nr:EAL domain-containing protein [Rhodocyclaceae bacterium]
MAKSIRKIAVQNQTDFTQARELCEIARAVPCACQLSTQEQILDQIHESVITMDMGGYIIGWNRGAVNMFGYSAAEVIGKHILFLYADPDAADDSDGFRDVFLDQGGREMEVRRRRKSGEVFWASLQLSLLRDETGQPSGLIGYLSDITERKAAEERIHYLAYYDGLTGLPNRSLLYRLIDQALIEAKRNRLHGAILFIDINRFKPINDSLGHGVGDRLLQQIAERLRRAVRTEDVVARLGGDEFVVALFDIAQREHAAVVAQKLIAALDPPFCIDQHELKVGAAIGISVYPRDGSDTESLLRMADIAMYRAKESQHDGYAFFNREMNRRALERLKIESGLRHGIEHNELLLYYQPKVDLASGRIVGAEALVRWQHPEHGMMSPDTFIPIAEKSGLIEQLSAWVMESAMRQARLWSEAGLPRIKVAINLSARDFSPGLAERVQTLLTKEGVPAAWIELEITEGMLTHNNEGVIAMMEALTALGVGLSLDDFGTGYSSLSYLKRFPIDTLKIDRSFITGIPHDGNDCAIAGAIVSMAQRLGHRVIAEGVETHAQLEFLRSQGCQEIQGHYFSPPLPADRFATMLHECRAQKWLGNAVLPAPTFQRAAQARPMRASAASSKGRVVPKLSRT